MYQLELNDSFKIQCSNPLFLFDAHTFYKCGQRDPLKAGKIYNFTTLSYIIIHYKQAVTLY